ncbi:hypothetical protein AV530_012677 [Patagioenas fasciata monilis]|uniref:Uncharacterized protein n=1 Tax=Patagioenas fasciata monilis TaxID=372326 RepID=A0A1V4JC65_PATFA|nr:hypothetical protein AV530_012677 [Patagioenas fasciata monilis]
MLDTRLSDVLRRQNKKLWKEATQRAIKRWKPDQTPEDAPLQMTNPGRLRTGHRRPHIPGPRLEHLDNSNGHASGLADGQGITAVSVLLYWTGWDINVKSSQNKYADTKVSEERMEERFHVLEQKFRCSPWSQARHEKFEILTLLI